MEEFLIRRKSNIHGVGIFTDNPIKNKEEFYIIPKENILHYAKRRCAYVGNNIWISDKFVLNYVNHSCEPTAVLEVTGEPRLIATRDIKNGEEITVDYNLTEKGGTMIPCNCGSKSCPKEFMTILGPGQTAELESGPLA